MKILHDRSCFKSYKADHLTKICLSYEGLLQYNLFKTLIASLLSSHLISSCVRNCTNTEFRKLKKLAVTNDLVKLSIHT